MDLIEAIGTLETNPELHSARLLVLLAAFTRQDGSGEIEGLTKLAKLDFLLRYPVMLERALKAKGHSIAAVQVQPHERDSVESRMVRYRFGPWDHRYREFLNLLVAHGLATIRIDGRTVLIGLTQVGRDKARLLAGNPLFHDVARRAATLKTHFDMTATHLMRFVYETFPELISLRMNEPITP